MVILSRKEQEKKVRENSMIQRITAQYNKEKTLDTTTASSNNDAKDQEEENKSTNYDELSQRFNSAL